MNTDKLSMFNAESFYFFVTAVLRQIAIAQGVEIQFDSTLSLDIESKIDWHSKMFDAVAPNGWGDIAGPVIFEFKYSSKRISISSTLNRLYRDIRKEFTSEKITVVLIANTETHNQIADGYVDSEALVHPLDIKTKIWGADVVRDWVSAYPIDFSDAVNRYRPRNIIDIPSINIVDKDFEEKKDINTKAIKNIIASEDSFALVLGAGVSVDPGAKTWEDLLEHFKTKLVNNGVVKDIDKVCKKIGGSDIITAQLFKELYRSEDDFLWEIHNGIYKDKKPINEDYAIYHVANIIKHCKDKSHFKVLTYNFDYYLEQYLDFLNLSYNTLYDADCVVNNHTSIYHVHGFLPYVEYKKNMLKVHKQSIHLTEANYNELYNNPYSWQISSQLTIFNENTCLFVGCGLADPNIRRLLDITQQENKRHYAILKNDQMSISDLTKASNHFSRLGIEVIWVDRFEDISSQLREFY